MVEVAAILAADSEVRNYCPVHAASVDEDAFDLVRCAGLTRIGMEEDEAAAGDHEGAKHEHRYGDDPVRTDLVRCGLYRSEVVALIGAIEGVVQLISDERIRDVPQFQKSSGGVRRTLDGSVAFGRSSECAVETGGDIGLRGDRDGRN